MPTRNVNLTDHLDKFVEKRVKTGQFSNASEVVREGLRLLEQRQLEDEAKLRWLRGAAKEGFDAIGNGDYVSIQSDADLDALFDGIHAEISPKRKHG
jgi:antitoxin ParD1/3/4